MTLVADGELNDWAGRAQTAGDAQLSRDIRAVIGRPDSACPADNPPPPIDHPPPVDLSRYRTVIRYVIGALPMPKAWIVQDPGRGALLTLRFDASKAFTSHVYIAPNSIDPAHPQGVEWALSVTQQEGLFPPWPSTVLTFGGTNFNVGGTALGYQPWIPTGGYGYINLTTTESVRDIKIQVT